MGSQFQSHQACHRLYETDLMIIAGRTIYLRCGNLGTSSFPQKTLAMQVPAWLDGHLSKRCSSFKRVKHHQHIFHLSYGPFKQLYSVYYSFQQTERLVKKYLVSWQFQKILKLSNFKHCLNASLASWERSSSSCVSTVLAYFSDPATTTLH
jgi:hypothetical protein